ncbi:aminotransferase class I/II-fold pyridoxal phosphate-dependent enzyme [Photobacterium rosenbergii]|uniref:Aminotransferase class I/II-fold pyridoxal phosphate-dependent enzyme n=1 Tax=Photobacterium rosenbergii TaxID=294936 RepID=A0ABU3ZI98_9GAMM|nr:aminotransferase class I/II-fold pyridoxal phosphate-dependent enzyme [Photobacterium rosenbergii]MDV5169703.1 aminotransferase class I/II-fold pyridoxal phosphate-dependent enzyme [Photobacterium rosenbergii]
MDLSTLAIHQEYPQGGDSHAAPISMTSAYDFVNAQEASDRFSGLVEGNVYSRFTNPSVSHFEQKLAKMENTEDAVAFASGMAAYLALAITYLKQGDNVLLASGIFGTTTHLYRQYFGEFGIKATSVDVDDHRAWEKAFKTKPKMVLIESPTNPLLKIANISWLSNLAKANGALLVVDNTLLSPVNQRPLDHGADLVLHSTGKFIDGQGRTVGGVIAGKKAMISPLKDFLRSSGTCMSPFTAWVLSHGLDTLKARMALHIQNAKIIAEWLSSHPNINTVYSTFNQAHEQTDIISTQQIGHSPVISFEVCGGKESAWQFIDSLKMITRCTNIGDTKTMVTHPSTTTHGRYTEEEKQKYGISDGLIRLCIGLETSNDLIDDIEQALVQSDKKQLREVV